MENLEDLELENMKALGLYIEKCVTPRRKASQYDEELRP
jgi:hypothetical protein